MAILGWITAFVVVATFNTIFNGYALSVLWSWFVVKTFGLPNISIPVAIGIAVIVSYLTPRTEEKKNDDTPGEVLLEGIAIGIAKPIFALTFGWIVVQFI